MTNAEWRTDTDRYDQVWGDKLGGIDDVIECAKKILFVVISRRTMATLYTFNRFSHIRNVHDYSDTILN